MANITRDFAQFLDDNGYGTLGTDLFIGSAPLDVVDSVYWVVPTGGTVTSKADTGEQVKQYIINVYYRDISAEDVYNNMQSLEELINSDTCTQLDNYETLDLEALSFASDQDLDFEDRTVGLLEVTITTYKDV